MFASQLIIDDIDDDKYRQDSCRVYFASKSSNAIRVRSDSVSLLCFTDPRTADISRDTTQIDYTQYLVYSQL